MDTYVKLLLCFILSALLSIAVKKHSPEIALLMGIACIIGAILVCSEIYIKIKTEIKAYIDTANLPIQYFKPLIKCCLISVCTQVGGNLCKDSGQAAMATSLEFVGNIISILIILPLLISLLNLIGELL